MRRDAVVARSQDGVQPGQATDGRTTAARLTLVARHARIVEVIATRALQQVASVGRHVADLRRGTGQNGGAEQRVARLHQWVIGGIGISRQCAKHQATVFSFLDEIERQCVDVDQLGRTYQVFFHQVDQVGSPGEKPGQSRVEFGQGGVGIGRRCVHHRCHAGTCPTTTVRCGALPPVAMPMTSPMA